MILLTGTLRVATGSGLVLATIQGPWRQEMWLSAESFTLVILIQMRLCVKTDIFKAIDSLLLIIRETQKTSRPLLQWPKTMFKALKATEQRLPSQDHSLRQTRAIRMWASLQTAIWTLSLPSDRWVVAILLSTLLMLLARPLSIYHQTLFTIIS